LVEVIVNGVVLTNSQVSYVGPVQVELQSVYPDANIFYTLDDSPPNYFSGLYRGPFTLNRSTTIRAIAYNADFAQAAESQPIGIEILPTYTLAVTNLGGGQISLSPAGGPYPSNVVVEVTAKPAEGWVFLGWFGDAAGTNLTVTMPMTRDRNLQPMFGTRLRLLATGNGRLEANPSAALYPYGTVVQLTAIPQPGSYLTVWGGSAAGNLNPLPFAVTNANPTVSCLFSLLQPNQVSLAVEPSGRGSVTVSPHANTYNRGTVVTLTAIPEPDQVFLGWSGDASGTELTQEITTDSAKHIVARFSEIPRFSLITPPSALAVEGAAILVQGSFGRTYRLESSTNLVSWPVLKELTIDFGKAQFIDAPGPVRFYRIRETQ
jgi:uncharacterized repeat protein (TIGR02543 family)